MVKSRYVYLRKGDVIQNIQDKRVYIVTSVSPSGKNAYIRCVLGKVEPDEQVIRLLRLIRFERSWRTSKTLQVLYGKVEAPSEQETEVLQGRQRSVP